MITALPDINVVIVSPVFVKAQVCKGDAFCNSQVESNPVANNEPDIDEIGNHQEVVRPLEQNIAGSE